MTVDQDGATGFDEHRVDLGEVVLNYVETGDRGRPAVLLVPGQAESWWGYRGAMELLAPDHHVFAVDLRGQGGSTRTPGRYTFDNLGNDLVRFLATVVARPVVVSGNSSGGVLAGWLSAFALPGQIRGAVLEDPPLFSAELAPRHGPAQRQSAGPMLELFAHHLGDQWERGDWAGLAAACRASSSPRVRFLGELDDPPRNFTEYDPEWSRAFLDGSMSASLRHERVLAAVRTPVLLTHHTRSVDPTTGDLDGALSDQQAEQALRIMRATGVPVAHRSLPDARHAMHATEPARFVTVLREWMGTLAPEA